LRRTPQQLLAKSSLPLRPWSGRDEAQEIGTRTIELGESRAL